MNLGDMVHSVLMLDLMEEDNNFLHPNICKYCIDLIKNNLEKTKIHFKRHTYNFEQIYSDHKDPTIKNLYFYYKSLYKNYYIKNIEIVYWPIGEKHSWHMDAGWEDEKYNYDITTITYLNEDYEGGRTIVKDKIIEPKIGKIIKFSAETSHMVTELTKGKRYVIVAWYNKNG